MNLGHLYMAMTVAHFKDHTMLASAAGMPPILIYRAATGSTEEIILKGQPLGGYLKFPYKEREIRLEAGDTLLLTTDGFEELLNNQRETLDYSRVKKSFEEVAD